MVKNFKKQALYNATLQIVCNSSTAAYRITISMIYLPPHPPHFSHIIPLIDGGSTLLVQIVISSQEQSLSSLNPIGPVVFRKDRSLQKTE
jgi:hypothetical protein